MQVLTKVLEIHSFCPMGQLNDSKISLQKGQRDKGAAFSPRDTAVNLPRAKEEALSLSLCPLGTVASRHLTTIRVLCSRTTLPSPGRRNGTERGTCSLVLHTAPSQARQQVPGDCCLGGGARSGRWVSSPPAHLCGSYPSCPPPPPSQHNAVQGPGSPQTQRSRVQEGGMDMPSIRTTQQPRSVNPHSPRAPA